MKVKIIRKIKKPEIKDSKIENEWIYSSLGRGGEWDANAACNPKLTP